MEIQAPRGVRDILPDESWKWAYVVNVASGVMADFGFREVHLPIFEQTELFSRGVGDTTDIVEKEMYTFTDRGDRSITLRPEGTAGMVRAAVENGLCAQGASAKLWCWGPMFRYERPQKGRYRQFTQIDMEWLGEQAPGADVECIDLAAEFFRRLGMKNLEVVINSVGCPKCRPVYRKALLDYFEAHRDKLCETCLSRMERNPLRILDCKKPSCGEVADGAPSIFDSLCDECRDHFKEVCAGLERLNFKYHLNKRLVRGLDYYTKTAFEILSGDLGAQNAVCGGGRYDNLSDTIGGPHMPSVGFACGLDRIVLVMEQQGCTFGKAPITEVYIVSRSNDEKSRATAQVLAHKLRTAGIATEMDVTGRSFKAQMKTAGNAALVCILPENADSSDSTLKIVLKEMSTGNQTEIPCDSEQMITAIKAASIKS